MDRTDYRNRQPPGQHESDARIVEFRSEVIAGLGTFAGVSLGVGRKAEGWWVSPRSGMANTVEVEAFAPEETSGTTSSRGDSHSSDEEEDARRCAALTRGARLSRLLTGRSSLPCAQHSSHFAALMAHADLGDCSEDEDDACCDDAMVGLVRFLARSAACWC